MSKEVIRVLLLTLDKHRDGEWLSSLSQQLVTEGTSSATAFASTVEVDIISIESYNENSFDSAHSYDLVVNRVSDAAPPELAKLNLVILHQFEKLGKQVVNGSSMYSLLMSKTGHHFVMKMAGVKAPKSVFVNGTSDGFSGCCLKNIVKKEFGDQFPILYKPCAAAFAKGVVLMSSEGDLNQFCQQIDGAFTSGKEHPLGNDKTGLLQEFIEADDAQFFRMFVLDGKFQCGVKVQMGEDAPAVASTCACSAVDKKQDMTYSAYKATEEEQREAVKILCHTVNADCGSVEFLYQAGKRLYFDVNLLSHLPDVSSGSFHDPEGLWAGRDFYNELAKVCLRKLT